MALNVTLDVTVSCVSQGRPQWYSVSVAPAVAMKDAFVPGITVELVNSGPVVQVCVCAWVLCVCACCV